LGAGDVKLMAAMGVFVGDLDIWMLSLHILMAGGLLAIFWAIWTERWREVLSNLAIAFFMPDSVGRKELFCLSKIFRFRVNAYLMPWRLAWGLHGIC